MKKIDKLFNEFSLIATSKIKEASEKNDIKKTSELFNRIQTIYNELVDYHLTIKNVMSKEWQVVNKYIFSIIEFMSDTLITQIKIDYEIR